MADHQPHNKTDRPTIQQQQQEPWPSVPTPTPASSSSTSAASRSPRIHPIPNHRHSHSMSDALRGVAPASRRHPSVTQVAVQSLIDNPPAPNVPNPAFTGRDWREICIGELVSPDDLTFVELDTAVEEATQVCMAPYKIILYTHREAHRLYARPWWNQT